jgi:hypothetical protein
VTTQFTKPDALEGAKPQTDGKTWNFSLDPKHQGMLSMIDLPEFKRLVDSSADNITPIRGELSQLYDYVGLPAATSWRLNTVTDELYNKIRGRFHSDQKAVWRNCRQLRNELIYAHILSKEALEPYNVILECLQDALRAPASVPPAEDDWAGAVGFAYDHVRLHPWSDANRYELTHVRQFAVARAALQLKKRGFEIISGEGNLRVDPASETRLIARLEELTKATGGINVASNIFSIIDNAYDVQQQRFHLVRRAPSVPGGVEPNVPFGFLLQLAAKHPALPRSREGIDQSWRELAELAIAYAAVFDVQPYNQFELMFKDYWSIVPFLQEVALYDSLFTIPQIRPRDAIKIAGGLLEWLDPNKEQSGGWSIAQALTVAQQTLNLAATSRGPVLIELGQLTAPCKPIPAKAIGRILERVFSHSLLGANQNFAKPYEPPGPDFTFKPLLKAGDKKYWLLNPSACATGFIEALFSPLREANKGFDDRIGLAIEDFLRKELESCGVAVFSGKYLDGGKEWECDLVVESAQTIFFLEIKKKPLTRRARAGTDVDVLLDLAGSLLDAQLQAGGHELRIKANGYLDLADESGRTTRISLNGREVERIAVSLFDFGGFQDRILLKLFLENTLGITYGTHDPSRQRKFDALNDKVVELRDQHKRLVALEPEAARQPFFHCWFLSVPQLLVLCDSVKSNDDFRAGLWKTRPVWFGTMDFYADHATINK